MHSSTPIGVFDSGHRKIPFEDKVDSHHIALDPSSSRANERLGVTESILEGLTIMKAKTAAKKPAAKKAAAKKPAAKKKK